MTIDTDKTLELLHNSPCSFSYNTNPSRYTIEQKELVKFVNFIYGKAIDDFVKLVKEHNWNIRNRNENEFIYGAIDRLSEQLKACGENDNLRR